MGYGLLRNVKYAKVGGGFVGVEGDASGRVSSDLWKKRKKKRFKKASGTSRLVGPRLGCLYQLASPGFLFRR